MGISRFVWQHKKAALLIVVILCVAGFYASQTLPVAIFPNLTAPRIIVTADAGDTPIPVVLANITRPLENTISGVTGVTKVDSLTQRGGDELDVNFSWGTDMQVALQQVQSKISQISPSLPAGVTVQAERLNPSVFPIMGYSLYSSSISPLQLRYDAQYILRPRLLRVPGVREISVLGGDTPDFLVSVSPSELIARGVTIQDVEDALSKNNEISSVGYYDKSYLRYQILVSGLFHDPAGIGRVTVAVKNRVPVTIGEIAAISSSVEKRTIETSGNGHDAVLINVIKQPNANTVEIAAGIKSALQKAQSALPPGITISNFYDQSQIVQESENSVLEAIIIGGVLALIVLMLFLGNLRTAAVVLIILPLTIVISFALIKALGQTMNIMTLGALAIALGLVIDDGIVVVENIFHELEQGRSRRAAIAAGVRMITPAMVGSSITTMAAFLPLTFLNDLTGQFFGPLALVMIATLIISLALALLLVPILADYLLPQNVQPHKEQKSRTVPLLEAFPRLLNHLTRYYTVFLKKCLQKRVLVLLSLLPILLVSFFLFTHLKTGFFPDFDEGGFILDYQLPDGTSLSETSRVAAGIEKILAKTPEVAAWSRRTGAQLGFDITTQNVGDMSVRLKRRRDRNIQAVMDSVRTQVEAEYPAAQVDFTQILQDNIGDIAGAPSPVDVKIFGDNSQELELLAEEIDAVVAKTPGIVGDFNGIVDSSPETVLNVNTENAARFGLTTDDITQAAQAATLGVEPTSVQVGQQSVGVRVMLNHSGQSISESFLGQIPIASPVTGGDVLLNQVAQVQQRPGSLQITRENQRQVIDVTANLSGRDLGSATAAIQRRIAANVKLPAGYTIEYGGLYASQQRSFAELGGVLLIAVIFVATLLVIQFRSIRQAIALLLTALLSLSGVLFALYISQTPLNISSFTGSIMIVGIITENGIMLFDFFNQLRRASPATALIDTMAEAGEKRLRPILMTTIAAILALLPLALGLGAGAALQKPLAIAVIGGLSVSIFFTLIVAPVIYVALESLQERRPHHEEQQELAEIERELSLR